MTAGGFCLFLLTLVASETMSILSLKLQVLYFKSMLQVLTERKSETMVVETEMSKQRHHACHS